MLTFNFTRIFKARGIDKPFRFLVKQGYSGNFATRIVNNRPKVLNLADVERLCELFQCTPNDLLQWIPSNADLSEKHPLETLKRSNKAVELTRTLSSVPLDRLESIEELIKNEIKKL